MELLISLVVTIVSMLCGGAMSQSQTNTCTNSILSMSPCLNYITRNSSAPTSGCCSALGSVVSSSPACLCQVLNGIGLSVGMNVNQTQALALPGACNVQTPLLKGCNVVVAAPADSPTAAADAPDISPSESESKTIPTITTDDGDGTSDGNATKLSTSLLLFILIASLYASFLITC